MVAAVASVLGAVAFVGLIAPHIARLLLGRRGGPYLPCAGWWGGAVLLCADLPARGLHPPPEYFYRAAGSAGAGRPAVAAKGGGLWGTMLEVRNLWAGYTDFVVRDLSFSVAGGELVGILGRNGSGKSTLLRGADLRPPAASGTGPGPGGGLRRPLPPAAGPADGPAAPAHPVLPPACGWRRCWSWAATPGRVRCARRAVRPGSWCAGRRSSSALRAFCTGTAPPSARASGSWSSWPGWRCRGPGAAAGRAQQRPGLFPNTHQFFRTLTGLLAGGERCALVVLHDPALALRWCGRLLLLEEGRLVGELRPGETGLHAVQSAWAASIRGSRSGRTGRAGGSSAPWSRGQN